MRSRRIRQPGFVSGVTHRWSSTLEPDPIYPPSRPAGPDSTLANYQAVVAALTDGVAPADIPLLSAFIGEVAGESTAAAYRRLLATSFDVDIFHEYLSTELRRILVGAQSDEVARGAVLAWPGGYATEAAMLAFRHTRDTRLLDSFVSYFDEVLALRDSELGLMDAFHGRAVAAWGDGRLAPGRWVAHVTTAARICYPATEFARLALRDERLAGYHEKARHYTDEAERAIAEFEGDYRAVPGHRQSYYFRPTTDRSEPFNHAHQVGKVLLNLHGLTGKQQYRQRISEIAAVFVRSVAFDRGGTPYWRYFPYFDPTRKKEQAELIWKASETVPFVYRAGERGYIEEPLVRAIARSFGTHLVRGGEMNRYIDPRRFKRVDADDPWIARVDGIVGWLEFAPMQPEIFGLVLDVMTAHRRDYFRGGWFRSGNLARGYADRLNGGAPDNLDAGALP